MFIQNLRAKIGARLSGDKEAGFTLIELLVVMLILGILAAIALPAFFNQKEKAGDAKAKETAHSLQVAMETCATDHNGVYDENLCNQAALHEIEPTIAEANGGITVEPEETGYTLTVEDEQNGNEFQIINNGGTMEYPCTVAGNGGCPEVEEGVGAWG